MWRITVLFFLYTPKWLKTCSLHALLKFNYFILNTQPYNLSALSSSLLNYFICSYFCSLSLSTTKNCFYFCLLALSITINLKILKISLSWYQAIIVYSIIFYSIPLSSILFYHPLFYFTSMCWGGLSAYQTPLTVHDSSALLCLYPLWRGVGWGGWVGGLVERQRTPVLNSHDTVPPWLILSMSSLLTIL